MTKILSSYSFLPWLRLGIANQIQDNDVKLRATVNVSLKIMADGSEVADPVEKQVGLYGPGDIIGIDQRAVIKTEPHNWITNFESNYLAAIEFYEEDFPWRYTPAKPGNDRLQPWLTLVVLKDKVEFDDGKDIANRPLPYITVKEVPSDLFPPANQLWAWAHVHVNDDLIEDDLPDPDDPSKTIQRVVSDLNDNALTQKIKTEYESLVNSNPDRAYSRILCPRRLEENTSYHAFLIPTFESGRLAGLGLDVEAIFDAAASLRASSSAWGEYAGKEESMNFPYYYRWYFKTGAVGDFEYLVRLLEPKPVDNRVGRRDMDVTDPGSNIEGITDVPENGVEVNQLNGILRLGGALRIPVDAMNEDDLQEYNNYNDWAKNPYPRKFQKQLAAFINLADDYAKKSPGDAHQNPDLPPKITEESNAQDEPDPLITAPLYGRWHSLTNRLLDPSDSIPDNNWVHELNLDPRFRVPSGIGTGVVQSNQETYMEAAWEQVGKVVEANRQIKFSQFALWTSKVWFKKNVENLYKSNAGAFFNLTQPIQKRVLSRGQDENGEEKTYTVYHHVKNSVVPSVVFSPSMRKFTRPRSRLIKGLDFQNKKIVVTSLADRINKAEVLPAPPKTIPPGLPTIGDVSEEMKPQKVPGFFLGWMEKHKWLKFLFLGIALLILLLLGIFVGPDLSSITPGLGSVSGAALLIALILLYLFFKMPGWESQISNANSISEQSQTPEAVDDYPKWPDFRLSPVGEGINFTQGNTDSKEASNFKAALKDVGELIQSNIEASVQPYKPQLNLSEIAVSTLQKIHPEKSIPEFILKNKIYIPERLKLERVGEVFREAMAYPEIDTPMYKPLIDLSTEFFLPNLNYIEQNTISLLETNQRFIEAYMVGLNHEFARELLWREFPTDQRGSYFRQFWDVSDYIFPQEKLDEIINQAKAALDEDATEEDINNKIDESIREKLMDIPKLHLWSKYSKLGDHDNREEPGENEEEVVLVIRGELLKKYPDAVIYAHTAKWKPKSDEDPTPDKSQERELIPLPADSEENPPADIVRNPLYEAKVDPDIYFFGFNLDVTEVKGLSEGDPADLYDRAGWFFVIKERPGEPRFGLDIGTTAAGEIEVWNDMAWGNVTPAVDPSAGNEHKFLQITSETTEIKISDNAIETAEDGEKLEQRVEDVQFHWNNSMNAAGLAYILYQSPVMVAVHGAEMIPKT